MRIVTNVNRTCHLVLVVVVHSRSILRSLIVALAVDLCGVVPHEEYSQEILVCSLRWIVHDLEQKRK